jgi:hypothetical protein
VLPFWKHERDRTVSFKRFDRPTYLHQHIAYPELLRAESKAREPSVNRG